MNKLGAAMPIPINTRKIGIKYLAYFLFSLISIALIKGTILRELERCNTLARINSMFPSFEFKLSFNCNVFLSLSEIDGKKEPIISEA